MAKIYLQLLTKNYAFFGDRVEFNSDIVPRAGELIDAAQFLKLENQVSDFMVLSVIYKVTPEGFAAYITARQWHKGIREELLQERGWLPGGHVGIKYDEDDVARCEPA